MAERTRLVDLSEIPRDRLVEAATQLRPFVPEIAAEAVQQIEREVPEYVRPHDPRYAEVLQLTVEGLIGHFVDLMGDPDLPSDEVLEFFRQVGIGEAREGRSLNVWQASIRVGAGVAIQRLSERSQRMGLRAAVADIGTIAQAVFAYVDKIGEAVAAGHAEAEARAVGERQDRRRKLIDLLLEPEPSLVMVNELARRAEWQVPRTVAAVALYRRDGSSTHRPTLPPDALVALHLPEPFLIVPDPEGPGRRQALESSLKEWIAAIGPAVEVTEVGKSLRWARQALELARSGLVQADRPLLAEEQMPLIVMMREPELVERIAAHRLAPLADVRMPLRIDLAETLLALLECRFNATVVAGRLRMHAQTIRYRLRKLEDLFGQELYDPAHQLELHMVLRAWLAEQYAAKSRHDIP